ncbi:FAD-linked oxidoreductase [Arthrobacter sp. MYb227]|uniref:D-arabinono-1,4-lactone oxidase n=1 Tax=Arthrobacter sp. MYb227 TaxID=1848601 RepID=UPI000CFCF666|nr:D-arabinono-1,4-lactone oxidase [Arthrobacter sp. MYb227]PQZ89033.1 FAD-linked oxidoreductase [Arthrobacter sp. MYb227]
MKTPRIEGLGRNGTWRNWAASSIAVPQNISVPADEDEIIAALGSANETGSTLKVVGGAHSFTPIAATTGTLMSLDRFSGIIHVDLSTNQVRFKAGTRLRDIGRLLLPYGLALANMGDIDHQSLAGAISTSTHGTGLGFTGFSGMVTALRIVLPTGEVRECNAQQYPELFQAARVGLGALGVLTEITLQCVPRFKLLAREEPEPLAGMLESFVDRVVLTDHLEFYWFPYTQTALTKTNTRLPENTPVDPVPWRSRILDDELMGNGAFALLCRLGAKVPATVPSINKLAAKALAARTYTDQSEHVFVAPRRVRFREMEYAVELSALPTVFAAVRRVLESCPERITFPLEVRATAADDTWLGTASGRQSAYIAVHRYAGEPSSEFFKKIEEVFIHYGGRPHWGKLHTQGAGYLASTYPRFDDFLAQRDAVDPSGVMLNEHLGHVLGR